MAERTADPTPPADPEIAGVALSAYAAVLAYVAEGVSLEQSLDHAAIPVAAWPQVEATWSARLAESAMEDGALVEACDQHRLAAQAHVDRKVPPLDTELRAWLDFFRAFTAAEDPLGFLEARGLGEGDVFRMLGFWHERIAADEQVRNEATALLAAAPGPAPEVRPQPPTLKAPTRRPRRAAKEQAKQRTASVVLSETQPLSNISEPILPFLQPVSAPAVSPPPPPRAPVVRKGLDEQTALAFPGPSAPALPFAGRAPRGSERGAPPSQDPALPPAAGAAPGLVEQATSEVFAIAKQTLPFAKSAPSPAAGAAPGSVEQATSEVFAIAKQTLPFAESAPSPAAPGPRLSLEDYVTMLAEIAASPAAERATIARYGLTPEGKRDEDSAWMARFAADPRLRVKWLDELRAAGERIRSKQ
ncbi:hypothetical protein BE21_08720 [Sorangium cellulosum]|uniref:Uncharacterized protein n=1 Tax=Sorangium cellulosum TaxID=56 RepID=A0A150U2C9_SORCE|nr:hypothetical protein BE21_08720 [Sorangium cellulosum]